MATTFNGITFPGVTRTVRARELSVPLQESKVFGLRGRTVIADESHGREVRITQWITGFATAAAVQTYLDTTLRNSIVGQRGTLVVNVTGTVYETYADLICREIDPNPTEVGTLPDTSVSPTTFHRTIVIIFEQLS